jgi:Mrp family chromosome partitioning ATPase
MNDVCWGELDFLLIDTPPGTSDEHLAVLENIKELDFHNYSAVLVTTPQVTFKLLQINKVKYFFYTDIL